jgi:methanethiol S-methyltransferase
MNPYLTFLLSFILWAGLHSLTSARRVKGQIARLLGQTAYEGLYRLLYNLFALLTFLPVFYLYMRLPDVVLWRVPRPWNLLASLLQLTGLIGLLYAIWQTDFFAFAGLKQAYRYLRRQPVNASDSQTLGESLVVTGLYRYIRHPLYSFSMLFLWANPTMTRNSLVLAVTFSLYFLLGSMLEERRLGQQFGEAYRTYQAQVPRFIPRLWRVGK